MRVTPNRAGTLGHLPTAINLMSCQRGLAERVTDDFIYNDKLRLKCAAQINPRIPVDYQLRLRSRSLRPLTLSIVHNCRARPKFRHELDQESPEPHVGYRAHGIRRERPRRPALRTH